MRAKLVHPAKGVRDLAERGGGITVEPAESPFEVPQLTVQDESAGPTFVRQLP